MSESGPSDPTATEPNRMMLTGSNSATKVSTRTSVQARNVSPDHTARLSRTAYLTCCIPSQYRTNPPMVRLRPRDQRRCLCRRGSRPQHEVDSGVRFFRCTDTATTARFWSVEVRSDGSIYLAAVPNVSAFSHLRAFARSRSRRMSDVAGEVVDGSLDINLVTSANPRRR